VKKALYAFVALLAIGAAGVYLALNYVDVIVKWALEHYGPDVTGVTVNVGEVKISPKDGRGSIRNLELGSPAGFSAPRTARLGEIRVALDPATLTAPVIVIHELVIDAPQVTYERGNKTTNLDAIQQRIDAYVQRMDAEGASQGREAARKAKRRFIVQRLTLRGARVTMTNPALRGQGIAFELPDVQLRDLGQREGGLTASELAARVTAALQNRIAQKVMGSIELLRRGGVEGAVDALKGLIK
jgi:uncharacterized protein involved in outer membrane biogenesis